MKKIKSKKNVTYNNSPDSSKTIEMIGEINEVYQSKTTGETEVIYCYLDTDGDKHSQGKYIITKAEADAIFPTISESLPDIGDVGFHEYMDCVYLEGFKIKMSQRFPSLTVSDIELID